MQHSLGVDLDLHAFADEESTGLEHLVPAHVEVVAIDLARGQEAGSHITPWVGCGTTKFDVLRRTASVSWSPSLLGEQLSLLGLEPSLELGKLSLCLCNAAKLVDHFCGVWTHPEQSGESTNRP